MYHLIVNPAAGNGKSVRIIDDVTISLDKRGIEYEIHTTKAPDHATEIAKELASKGVDIVVAVGGDGTVAEVGKGLIGTDTAMGIIPAGTGNDYRKSFDIPDDIDNAVEYLVQGKKAPYDAFSVNGETYLNIASMGFDVDVVRRAGHYKIFGSIAYTLAAVEAAFFAKSHKAKITIDDKTMDKDMLLLAVGCGTHYGGGMNPLPNANKSDGVMDVCLIDYVRTLKILKLLPQFVAGKHEVLDEVTMYKAKEVTINLDDTKLKINADGEILEATDIFHAKILPAAINIIRL